jgi:hypothetical protein
MAVAICPMGYLPNGPWSTFEPYPFSYASRSLLKGTGSESKDHKYE